MKTDKVYFWQVFFSAIHRHPRKYIREYQDNCRVYLDEYEDNKNVTEGLHASPNRV